MQNFKHILLTSSLVVALTPLYLHADDNDAQATARAALQQRMRELSGAPAAPAPSTPPPAPVAAPAVPTAPEPVTAPVTPAAPVAPATPQVVLPAGASPDLIEQARQATRERMSELRNSKKAVVEETPHAQPAASVPASTSDTLTTTTVVKAPAKEDPRAAKQREAAAKAEAKAKARAEAEAKAKAAAEAKAQANAEAKTAAAAAAEAKAKSEAHAPAASKKEPVAKAEKKTKPAEVKQPAEAPAVLIPLEAPASGLSAAKEKALHDLLEQYRADKVSSDEYQVQRAKILAEP